MSLILNSGFTVGPGTVLDSGYDSAITPVSAGLRLHLDAGVTASYPGITLSVPVRRNGLTSATASTITWPTKPE